MNIVGRLLRYSMLCVFFLSITSGISCASLPKGNSQVFFHAKMASRCLADGTTSFCVAKQNADQTALSLGINWACGPGLANCTPIQPGQPCYVANNLVAIASFAYDAYYQASQSSGGTCFFNNTAMLTNIDPSNGSCIFPGSNGSVTNSTTGSSTNSTGGSGSLSPGSSSFAPPFLPNVPIDDYNSASRLQIFNLVIISALVLPLLKL
ncbi:hypothetical protein HPP92_023261 [Vanilla planifolia]|uniref:X8 domain-containing protein n=1 Tax=Vanilla planifolia TaxID=51239 RepID=A0A835UG70_VANPL|nr:hypothetical protein HPP92_023564 [Vanilla planifolia]KAG0460133.1 hypothetical protein HPP92_023261 [Vanilla planifolia]